MASAQLSCSVSLKPEETIAEEETLRSKLSSWPEKLIDFEDLGNSEDDGYTDSWTEKKIGRRTRIRSAPADKVGKKSKTVPTPFKMTLR